ncbi:ribonuclease III [Candidatus Atribacteria bacterium RBG_19FT_COMBO_35_14]|uniref:Ribonuclease 3 n=1 Tax=Candidatus Sediminicultor quintus TaxID=1797291 RepID=A0A1F5A6L1_9BACT|nr:MAG: ribonuclease III [Candidatus Atribacteria bacterium RBG_19FT_COMBO_35_14]
MTVNNRIILKKEKYLMLNYLEKKLDYKFKNKTLLNEALTHPSFQKKSLKDKTTNNQRLEFLGDSVLNLIVTEHLYRKLTSFSEGKLTKIKSVMVSKDILAKWADRLSLGKYIILGKGEDSTGGRNKLSILADCFEALLGAIYLDSGLQKAKKIISSFINKETELIMKGKYGEDYKTLLQEISQKKMKCLPEYCLIKEKGPDHKKIFCIEVRLKKIIYGSGTGENKKEAEQNAAQNALKKLKITK